jgi:hypothetical protein
MMNKIRTVQPFGCAVLNEAVAPEFVGLAGTTAQGQAWTQPTAFAAMASLSLACSISQSLRRIRPALCRSFVASTGFTPKNPHLALSSFRGLGQYDPRRIAPLVHVLFEEQAEYDR